MYVFVDPLVLAHDAFRQLHNGGADDEDAAARATKAGLKRADKRASSALSAGADGGRGKKGEGETKQRAAKVKTPARSSGRKKKVCDLAKKRRTCLYGRGEGGSR